jgi:uncharacterized membrane protein YvbJ
MKNCTKCGFSNPTETAFCGRCGNALDVVVVQQQPTATSVPNKEPMPQTYLWQAIVVTILCCLPLGIPAIVFASQVENRWRNGDFEGARRSSRSAKNFALWSLISALVVWLFYIVFVVLIGAASLGGFFL